VVPAWAQAPKVVPSSSVLKSATDCMAVIVPAVVGASSVPGAQSGRTGRGPDRRECPARGLQVVIHYQV
jgi:hypothetical protein